MQEAIRDPRLLAVYRRNIRQQMYNQLRVDYEFPRAVCESLCELFMHYLDLYVGPQVHEGQVIYYAVSKEVPPGVPVEEMEQKPVRLTLYSPEDLQCPDQASLLEQRILRLTHEALDQGGLLTQADLGVLLGASLRTVQRHIRKLEASGHLIPTRGRWKDIGSGTSHKRRIVELYLEGDEYTDIRRKTRHSFSAIERYLKEFARVLILHEEGYDARALRLLTGLSERTLREYLDLIEQYQGDAYEERLADLRRFYGKKSPPVHQVLLPEESSHPEGRCTP